MAVAKAYISLALTHALDLEAPYHVTGPQWTTLAHARPDVQVRLSHVEIAVHNAAVRPV
jgi:hypothetical protein